MRPINFSSANKRFNPPAGSKPGDVSPVMAYVPEDGGFILTCWQPTAAELHALNHGASIVLHVLNRALPPIAMSVMDQVEVPESVHAPAGDFSQTRCGLSIDAGQPIVTSMANPDPLPKGHTWTKNKDWVTCSKCKELP